MRLPTDLTSIPRAAPMPRQLADVHLEQRLTRRDENEGAIVVETATGSLCELLNGTFPFDCGSFVCIFHCVFVCHTLSKPELEIRVKTLRRTTFLGLICTP